MYSSGIPTLLLGVSEMFITSWSHNWRRRKSPPEKERAGAGEKRERIRNNPNNMTVQTMAFVILNPQQVLFIRSNGTISGGSSFMCCMITSSSNANSSYEIVTLNTFTVYLIRSVRSFLRSFLWSSHFDLVVSIYSVHESNCHARTMPKADDCAFNSSY